MVRGRLGLLPQAESNRFGGERNTGAKEMSLPVLADFATTPILLEAVMLACFGLAWPLANVRMLRTGQAEGKGLAFTTIIFCGYLAGAGAKLAMVTDAAPLAPIFWFYLVNAGSVGANIFLQQYLKRVGLLARDPASRMATIS
ncbi:MAG: hypothetical protein ING60_12085 [Rhodocyclaceae bacterium]|jgi:hypothetical protein|nr:hypothetical protein [Rhodocyclaceae bacterium]MCA3060543.1 hypothetical protein [Rhodocyclaceae bacterium]MCA3087736.1 hypothetical protein [Rhodocyclaceae bacterium]